MKKIYFATTNKGKLAEAKKTLGIEILGTPLEIDEIQSLDPVEVATKKARAYFDKLKKPILIEDVSLTFAEFGRLPGTYISDFLKQLGNKGLVKLLKGAKNRKAEAQTTLVYVNAVGSHVFKGVVKGEIAEKPKGVGFGWDPIFVPGGYKRTFGQMSMKEKNKISMRAIALKKFKKWLDNK